MDRRVKYTKKIIRDTFLDLLQEKEINKITVSEICKNADINRATFYRYYIDVYDLLDKIELDFVEQLKQFELKEDTITVKAFSKEYLTVFLENKELVKILFSTKNNVFFLNEFLELVYSTCKKVWNKEMPDLSEEEIETAAVFIFNGALGVINYWVINDFNDSVEHISDTIGKLSYYGLRSYIYHK